MAGLSAGLVEAALFPELDLPDPPPDYPFQIRYGSGYRLGFTRGTSYAMVFVRRLGAENLAEVVNDVRSQLRAEGFERAAWVVSESAEPEGIAGRLRDHGLVSWERDAEGFEPRFRSMALATEPAAPSGVIGRQVETFGEYVAAAEVAQDAFDMSDRDRRAFRERQSEYWEWQQRYAEFKTFGAFLDGEVVGCASVIFGRHAAFMVGGSVRADRRGRGAYRALVRARWDAAVARGTPALTVTAGTMSGPVLDRLGFTTVGWGDVLSDRFP